MTHIFAMDIIHCRMGKRGRPRLNGRTPTVMGVNLARLRAKHRLSQQELVDRTGGRVSQADISRIETGETQEPSAQLLKWVADALDESVAEFWIDPDEPANKDAMQTLDEFLASPLGRDATPEQIEKLRGARWPFGVPTARGWFHALELLRTSEKQ